MWEHIHFFSGATKSCVAGNLSRPRWSQIGKLAVGGDAAVDEQASTSFCF